MLGGGGARGFAHIGVLRALDESGIEIDRIGGALGDIERICAEVRQAQVCSIANFNSPNQAVIAGTTEAVDRAVELLSGVAKRVIKLKVSAPFHCALMKPAEEELEHKEEPIFRKAPERLEA